MPRLAVRNLVGQRFGKWKVKFLSTRVGNAGQRYWTCACSCNGPKCVKEVSEESLIAGISRSCGCLMRAVTKKRHARKRSLLLLGKTFDRWTVLKTTVRNHKTFCLCKCACLRATVRWINAYTLKAGQSKSCGCIRSEETSLRCRKPIPPGDYGTYSVIEPAASRNGHSYSKCICNCGTLFEAHDTSLRKGAIISCGCYRRTSSRERWGDPDFRQRNLVAIRESNYGRSNQERRTYRDNKRPGQTSAKPIELILT